MGYATRSYTTVFGGDVVEVQEDDNGVVLASHALHDAIAALQAMLEHAPHDADNPRPEFDAACDKAAAAIAKAAGEVSHG